MRNHSDAGAPLAMGFRIDNLRRLLDVLDADEGIDIIALDLGTGLSIDRWLEHPEFADGMIGALADFSCHSAKPGAVILEPAHREAEVAQLRRRLRGRGVLALPSPHRAARALRLAIGYHRFREGLD